MNRDVPRRVTESIEKPGSRLSEDQEKALDKTIEDSFPTSDPPSTIPDPGAEQVSPETTISSIQDELVRGLPAGSWAAISIEERRVVGKGASRDQAAEDARRAGHSKISLVQVAGDEEAPGQTQNLAS
jgi:hypothetical protein